MVTLRRVAVSCATRVTSILARHWNSLQPLCHFAWHWACQCTDTRAFILPRALSFSFVSGDLALTGFWLLTWTSDFHCFGALGVGPWARTRPHVRTWCMSVIIEILESQSTSDKRCLALVFPWIVENTEYKGPLWGFFNPHSQTGLLWQWTMKN